MLAYDPYIEELVITQYGVEPVGFTECSSDIVSMHAPSMSEAYHLMTEDHFRLMKPEAIFINTSRGATVDESALIKALQEGWIAALVWMFLNRSRLIRPIRFYVWTTSFSARMWPQPQPNGS